MSLKAKIEAIVYAAEEPATVDQILAVVGDELSAEQVQASERSLTIDSDESEPGDVSSQDSEQTLTDAKQQAKRKRDVGRRRIQEILDQLVAEYDSPEPEHHDVVRSFARSLKPPIRLSLQALETLAVIAYKQPVTAPEISEIRGVDSSGVLAGLLSRKFITTAGRKQVVGRPILYKTTKDFLMRFGLKDLNELPSIEEFEKLTSAAQSDLFPANEVRSDATGVSDVPTESEADTSAEGSTSSNAEGHFEEKIIESN
jgi:segregation and condensation protein B